MIAYDDENFLSFALDVGRAGVKLPTIEQWIRMTEESYSVCDIGFSGTVTEPYNFQGVFIDSGNNKFGIMPGHEYSPFIFRGQNRDFPHFLPSAKRFDFENIDERIRHCIEWVNKKEFLETFELTPYYHRCRKFQVVNCKYDFNLEAIAQHYEFISNYIDLTRDLNVALFFAYTFYDKHSQSYRPVDDFTFYSPTLYVSNLKTWSSATTEKLRAISFQALLRPHVQKALALDMQNIDEKELKFKKYELPKSQAFASEVFYNCKRGNIYFPNDIIGRLEYQIKNEKMLRNSYFYEYCNAHSCNSDLLREQLLKSDYRFTDEPFCFDEAASRYMNNEIDNGIIPFLNNKCAYRGISEMAKPPKFV